MKRQLLTVTITTAALALAAPATADAATTHAAPGHSTAAHGGDGCHHGHGSAHQLSAQDRTWLASAAASDLFEIASGRVAARRAHHAGVREFGAHLVRDHTTAYLAKVKLAETFHVTIPRHLTTAQLRQLNAVGARHGAAFDKAYLTAQVSGHQAALAGTNREVRHGDDDAVVAEARKEAPVIAGHLHAAEALLAGSGSPH